MFFVALMRSSVFRWCFAYVFAYLLGSLFPRMLGKNSLLLKFGFELHFRERTFFFFVALLHSSVFRWCFANVLQICCVFCSRKCLAKSLFVLGLVPETPFRERTFVLLSCCAPVVGFLDTFPFFAPLSLLPLLLSPSSSPLFLLLWGPARVFLLVLPLCPARRPSAQDGGASP